MAELWRLITLIISKINPPIAALGFTMLCAFWIMARNWPREFSWLSRKIIAIFMIFSLKYYKAIPTYFFGGFKKASLDTYLASSIGEDPTYVNGILFGAWILFHGGLVLAVVVMEIRSLPHFGE